MKKLIISFLLVASLVPFLSGFTQIPVSNTLSDFIAKLDSVYIALFTDLEDDPQIFRVVKFGHNEDVDAAANEDIWAWGGSSGGDPEMIYPTVAETLTVVSTSTADDDGGTGANAILINCIQSDGTETLLTVTMDGTTPVITTQTCLFVNRIQVIGSGSGQKNAGDIKVSNTTSGNVLGWVETGISVTHQLLYRVPSDCRCHINNIYITANKLSGGGVPRVIFYFKSFTNNGINTEFAIRRELIDTSIEATREFPNFRDRALLPNEIVTIEVETNTNDTQISGAMDITCRAI